MPRWPDRVVLFGSVQHALNAVKLRKKIKEALLRPAMLKHYDSIPDADPVPFQSARLMHSAPIQSITLALPQPFCARAAESLPIATHSSITLSLSLLLGGEPFLLSVPPRLQSCSVLRSFFFGH